MSGMNGGGASYRPASAAATGFKPARLFNPSGSPGGAGSPKGNTSNNNNNGWSLTPNELPSWLDAKTIIGNHNNQTAPGSGPPHPVPTVHGGQGYAPGGGGGGGAGAGGGGGMGGPSMRGVEPQSTGRGGDTTMDLSPRGKHKYPAVTPWNCNHIATWVALVLGFSALVVACLAYFPHKHHGNGDTDVDRRSAPLSSDMVGAGEAVPEQPHENYVAFRFEAETGPARWPKTGVIAGLTLEDIVATRLCCVVGSQQYFVCDSSQGLTNNLGIAFVVRNVPEEQGAHLLITAPSADMSGSRCIFSWQTRIHQHDKAALVVAKGEPAAALARTSRFSHVHAGRRTK